MGEVRPSDNRLIAEALTLEQVSDLSFVAAEDPEERRLFGGKRVAQAVGAAALTVSPERPVHSLNGNFLLAGDGRQPIVYEVERTRDGASFSLRRIVARQEERLLFVANASFQVSEVGLSYESPGRPACPVPTGCRRAGTTRDTSTAATCPKHTRRPARMGTTASRRRMLGWPGFAAAAPCPTTRASTPSPSHT